MTLTVAALLVVAAIGLVLCLLALADEIQRAVNITKLYPLKHSKAKHSWESTQGDTRRLDGQPTAILVALDKDQAVWRKPE